MSTFTMTVADIVGVNEPSEADPVVLGLDRYPIWNESYRAELNEKIVARFWNRNIGFETVDMFRHHMRRTLAEVMPTINKLAETTLWEFDPFETVNMTVSNKSTATGETEGMAKADSTEATTGEQSNNSTSNSRAVASEHPQTRLSGDENYATSSNDAVSQTEGGSTSAGKGEQSQVSEQSAKQRNEQDGQSLTRGFQGDRVAIMERYRDAIIGVDLMVLDALEPLFMGLWCVDQALTGSHSDTSYYGYSSYYF